MMSISDKLSIDEFPRVLEVSHVDLQTACDKNGNQNYVKPSEDLRRNQRKCLNEIEDQSPPTTQCSTTQTKEVEGIDGKEKVVKSAPLQSDEKHHVEGTVVMEDGNITAVNISNEKLTYIWRNLDVFHEIPESIWSNRVKGMFCAKKNAPALRNHLLKNVCGIAYPGELLAVLGCSGAGKTTLLNALAFRSPGSVQVSPTTMRMLNGHAVEAEDMRTRCAYVQQDDLFIGSLTAKEHLIFQAMLRMPRSMTYRQKVQRVDQVIQDLSLGKCQNTIIGVPGRIKGLSGGERKRLALASEALTDPPLLICDEPTSGLDSFMARSVVQVLKKLAQKGKTVIHTIHQPSSELFQFFDKILLMAEGRVAFLGTPTEAADFFLNFGLQCPSNYNPADFYVRQLAVVPGRELKSWELIGKICDSFAVGKVSRELERTFQVMAKTADVLKNTDDSERLHKTSWFLQFGAVFWRTWICIFNDPTLINIRLIQTIVVAFLIGSIFYQQPLSPHGIRNINGAVYISLINMTYQNLFCLVALFMGELPVFMRESRNNLYRCDTYFLGKTLAELPLFVLFPCLFTAIANPLIGLRSDPWHFFVSMALLSLATNAAMSFGYLVSCASSSAATALAFLNPMVIPMLLFGGFFMNSGSIPDHFKWLTYLSWFRYGNEALLINQWADIAPGEIVCSQTNATCPTSGQMVLEELHFSRDHLAHDCWGLALQFFGFRLIAYLFLVIRTKY